MLTRTEGRLPKRGGQVIEFWSGREDLNLRPLAPHVR